MLHLSRLLLPSEVVTACHSLVYLEEGLVGDPQEKATLAKTDWILTKEEIIGWLCVMSNALSLRATPRATHQQQQEDEEERTFTSCLIQCDWGFFQQLARVQRQAEQEVSVHPREMHSTQPQHRQAPAPSPSASHSWTPQLQHCGGDLRHSEQQIQRESGQGKANPGDQV
ncbi:endoplasmic reticulum transmembrane helix translocase-like isoform X7 [Scylla paramamosain]|uniref:endoplasmic reticulum transmembrane helix translocase-like isoform X7 n=1 Tax=Scylla paramamosain TaxID=85552 RepID=UPI003083E047